jgi:hypothetical protein
MAQGCCIRHQGNGPCTFDLNGQFSLVLGAITGYPPRDDLAAFCSKKPERPRVLIIDGNAGISTEPANLSPSKQSLALIRRRSRWLHYLIPPGRWFLACSPGLRLGSPEILQSRLILSPLYLHLHLTLVRQVRVLMPVLWPPLSLP